MPVQTTRRPAPKPNASQKLDQVGKDLTQLGWALTKIVYLGIPALIILGLMGTFLVALAVTTPAVGVPVDAALAYGVYAFVRKVRHARARKSGICVDCKKTFEFNPKLVTRLK